MVRSLHSILRGFCIAVMIAQVPLGAIACRMASLFVSSALDEFFGTKPRPVLTTLVVEGQAHSLGTFYCSVAVAILLIAAAAWVSRLPEADPWRATGQIVVTAVSGAIAFSLCAVTMVAAFLPFIRAMLIMRPE